MKKPTAYWHGTQTKCDICGKPFGPTFYDFKTAWGPWALACHTCFKAHNGKLGTGRGQEYDTNTKQKLRG